VQTGQDAKRVLEIRISLPFSLPPTIAKVMNITRVTISRPVCLTRNCPSRETETGNTPFAPAEDRATLGSDPSADLEPCEPQEAGRGLTTRPAKLLRGQVQSDKSTPPFNTKRTTLRIVNARNHQRPAVSRQSSGLATIRMTRLSKSTLLSVPKTSALQLKQFCFPSWPGLISTSRTTLLNKTRSALPSGRGPSPAKTTCEPYIARILFLLMESPDKTASKTFQPLVIAVRFVEKNGAQMSARPATATYPFVSDGIGMLTFAEPACWPPPFAERGLSSQPETTKVATSIMKNVLIVMANNI